MHFDARDPAILAEDHEQVTLLNVVGQVANVDGIANDIWKDGVVGANSRLALVDLCEGEREGLVVAESLSLMVSEVDQVGQTREDK